MIAIAFSIWQAIVGGSTRASLGSGDPPPTGGSASLDFSNAGNSQYVALLEDI